MSIPEDTADPAVVVTENRQHQRSWRPLVLRMHFYAGLLVAPFILVAAVTGAL